MRIRGLASLLSSRLVSRSRSATWKMPGTVRFWEIGAPPEQDLREGSNNPSGFPQHRILYLPRAVPDVLRAAQRTLQLHDPNALWEVLVLDRGPDATGFQSEAVSGKDLLDRHRAKGIAGHLASASVAFKGKRLYGLDYRVGGANAKTERDLTAVAPHMLLNALMAFAIRNGVTEFLTPTSHAAGKDIDAARMLGPDEVASIYDRVPQEQLLARREGDWWAIDVAQNRGRVIFPEARQYQLGNGKTICLYHDLERGCGHEPGSAIASQASERADECLERMLEIERKCGVRATYNVVASFLEDVRDRIERNGHCIAFHSFDHAIDEDQLSRCRKTDDQVRGYRPPRSIMTSELRDDNLCLHNFEWFAASARALQTAVPVLENRIAKIPIAFDDYPLYKVGRGYREWEAMALATIRRRAFVAFGLHDCYAQLWLPHYEELLQKIQPLGTLSTMDEVTDRLVLAGAQ